MLKQELDRLRDEICAFCFDKCEHMLNSEEYNTCSLSKSKSFECKVWEFLRAMYTKYPTEGVK